MANLGRMLSQLREERIRVQKELDRLEREKSNGERQLADEGFISKAPANVVEQRRVRVEELKGLIDKLRNKLGELDQNRLSG